MDYEDEEYHYSKLRTKGKSKNHLPISDVLELKRRTQRQGKCVGAALKLHNSVEQKIELSNEQQDHTFICDDIWFHVSNYIAPENVGRYSLICSQSANSINSRAFWLQMFRRYCQQATSLPKNLRMEYIKNCDRNTLRQSVIQALFYCYPHFISRLDNPYTLDTLVGRTYVSSWYKPVHCLWRMCHKFKLTFPLTKATKCKLIDLESNENEVAPVTVVENWECLAEEENNWFQNKKNSLPTSTTSRTNDLDGISILVIYCDRFIPFPPDIIFSHNTASPRLTAVRKLLSNDMRSIDLELDLISGASDQTITVKYKNIKSFKVVPWWRPEFTVFNKFE